MTKPLEGSLPDLMHRLQSSGLGGEEPEALRIPEQAADPLAEALSLVARHWGRPIEPVALTAGLPLVGGRLPVEHLALAAERAGLVVSLAPGDPSRIGSTEVPAILIGPQGAVRLLWRAGEPVPQAQWLIARLRPVADDDTTSGALPAGPKSWFWPAFRESRRIYAEAIVATLAINLLALAMPLFSMNVYDRVLPNQAADTLWALSIGVFLALCFDFALKQLRALAIDAASRRGDVILANLIYARLLGARMSAKPAAVGVRANTLREFETLREFLNSATLTTFGDLPFLVVFLIVMSVVAGPLALVAIVSVPLVLAVAWATQRAVGKAVEAAMRDSALKSAVVVETLVGLESIKAAGAESWAALRWESAVAESIRTGQRIRNITNLGINTVQWLQSLVQLVIVMVGFYMVAAGSLTIGALIAATILSGRALQPVGAAAMLIARLNQTRLAFRQIDELVRAEQERPAKADLVSKERFDGRIALESVTLGYERDGPPALSGVSFELAPGERVAMVGAVGSGKSSALRLIQGHFAPTDGRVLVDGLPVGSIDPAILRRAVALLPQAPELFRGTIRSNIALAHQGASDAAVIAAAEAAGALSFIQRLPKGFDSAIGERGAGLSGGQRQLVALARALMGSPSVLLLDEPTSDMDGRTEAQVIERLGRYVRGKTLVFVTHRPALLELADRIIVFEAGRVFLDGPKAEVLDKLRKVTEQRGVQVKVPRASRRKDMP